MNCPYIPSAPLVIVSGHFGSGKTNISVALALEFKRMGKSVTLVDLDIVNPYFRAADAEELLRSNGIKCINPEFANTNVDVPSLGSEIQSVFVSAEDPNSVAIFDVGGDNGAAALGRYKRDFDRIGYDMLCVVSKYRPLSETPELAIESVKEIEYCSRLRCTHIINNSNIGGETTLEDIENSFEYSERICELTSRPEAFTCALRSDFSDTLKTRNPNKKFFFMDNTTKKLF